MCSYLMLEIIYFVSLKNESFLFCVRVHFKGGVKFSKILREVAQKEGCDRFRFFFGGGGGLGRKG